MDLVKSAMAGELGQYRKYGAKKETQTRDSTRHYFRCKVDDCPSRKIVEVFTNGQVNVEARGTHNHPDCVLSGSTIPSKRSSEEVERPVHGDDPSLTRSKRASAANVSQLVRLVNTSTQALGTCESSSLPASPRPVTPLSPRTVHSQGGSPQVVAAGPSTLHLHHFSMSPPPVADVYAPSVKTEVPAFVRSSTPQANRDSPHQSYTHGTHYATPDHRSFSPAFDQLRLDPLRAEQGANALASGPSASHQVATASQPSAHPAAAAAASVAGPSPSPTPIQPPVSEIAEDKPSVVTLPMPLPAQPHAPPASSSQQHSSIAVGLPAPISAPARLAGTPDPAPPTSATAGTSSYPGHEGVPVSDPRVTVNEWRAEEGVLGLLFTGSEKEYSDAYCWRKYGKKSIKGHAMPRFYWRCTHKQCDIKRHTQATEDGRTEVRYYGRHCHSPPPHKTSRGRRTGGPSGLGAGTPVGAPASPRSGTAGASSGASPISGAVLGAALDSAGADSAQPSGARAGLVRDARRRAVGARAMMASDDEYEEDHGPPRQRQRRMDVDSVPGAGGQIPPNLSRCPLYFLACVAANQAR